MQQMINVTTIATGIGGVKTPPYITILSARPYSLYPFVENLGLEGVNLEAGPKALRKLQHSCNF